MMQVAKQPLHTNLTTRMDRPSGLHSTQSPKPSQGPTPPCSAEDKENVAGGKTGGGWLSKVCSRLRSKQKRGEKCEKCGQRSQTCQPNASFLSGKKHFLCQDCRASSHNVMNIYTDLCRNLGPWSQSSPSTASGNPGSVSGKNFSPASSRGLFRSRSARVRRPAPESGYETATSLDSSCSNPGRSSLPLSSSSADCGPCPLRLHPDSGVTGPSSKDKVFCGGAFKSELAHLEQLQSKQRVFSKPRPPGAPHMDQNQNYDGYLQVRAPDSESVKYVFTQADCDEGQEHEEEKNQLSRRRHSENFKLCYRCNKLHTVAFRAPFGKGWLCEDCSDDLL